MSERLEVCLKEAIAHHLAGRAEEASLLYALVLEEDPAHFQALHLSGAAACQADHPAQAIEFFGRALRLQPDSAPTHMCFGLALSALGRNGEAEEHLKRGLELDPRNAEVWANLGAFLVTAGRLPDAMKCYQRAVELRPAYAHGWIGLGAIFKLAGRGEQAIANYRFALKLEPDNPTARLGLVQALQSCNQVTEAIAACDHLLELRPAHVRARSSRLFLLNYVAGESRERVFEAHVAFDRMFPPANPPCFPHVRDPGKRLKIAFLSPDLRSHPVACFLEPLLANLDRTGFETALYHDHSVVDDVSERLRSRAARWRNLVGYSDSAVEAILRADQPDLLIDLAGHSGQNRLHLFARRLAPVQITYLGYPNTTGLAAMDYRFTDGVADPEGEADRWHTESLVRFAPCAWAYEPPAAAPDPSRPPCLSDGAPVTFGSFNSLSKVNDFTLRLWSEVIAAVPGSRLVVKSFGLDPASLQARLAAAGFEESRLSLLPPEEKASAHLACYHRIDVALDPHPYAGTTTTCEALWMGRPVVTLAGDRHAARVGASLLKAIGKPQWVAHSREEFVRIAAGLAADRERLGAESAGLRAALRRSPLFDHAGQGERFGQSLRRCWTRWCESACQARPAELSAA